MLSIDDSLPHCLSSLIPPQIPVQTFSIKAGKFLFKENQPVTGVFYICFGKVQIFKNNSNGIIQKLSEAGIDEWIGISAALFEKYYINSARALTDVKVCFITLEDFDKMLPENPVLAKKLLQNLTTRLNKLDHMHTL